MKIPTCSICNLPVLELEGQFSVLQPYFAPPGDSAPARSIAGWCHSPCLSDSGYGPTWYEWQLQHLSSRGYERVGDAEGWTVLQLPRAGELLALREDGTSVGASRSGSSHAGIKCEGGLCLPRDEEYNLELEDEALMTEVKSRLQGDGSYPILDLYRGLGIEDKIGWPQALEKGVFRFDKKLARHWGRFAVSMRAVYQVFLPEVVIPFWKQLGRTTAGT